MTEYSNHSHKSLRSGQNPHLRASGFFPFFNLHSVFTVQYPLQSATLQPSRCLLFHDFMAAEDNVTATISCLGRVATDNKRMLFVGGWYGTIFDVYRATSNTCTGSNQYCHTAISRKSIRLGTMRHHRHLPEVKSVVLPATTENGAEYGATDTKVHYLSSRYRLRLQQLKTPRRAYRDTPYATRIMGGIRSFRGAECW